MLHTFTLGKSPLKKKKYKRIVRQLYELADEGYIPLFGKKLPPQIHIQGWPGITLVLRDKVVPRLELKINPSIMFGGDYTDLAELSEFEVRQIESSVSELLDTLEADFTFDDMCLSRIDCTQDITIPDTILTTVIIGAIQRTKLKRDYERTEFGRSYHNYVEKNRHSFRARCNDISLTVYDKGFQLAEEGMMFPEDVPINRLRFEVAFDRSSFRRVLNEHQCGTYVDLSTGETILEFSRLSVKLLREYFHDGIAPGRILRLDAALKEIEKSHYTCAIKERMKDFMVDVSGHYRYGVEGALADSGLNSDQKRDLLARFRELDLNPVGLPMRCKCVRCPSIDGLLVGEMPT